MVIEVVSTKGNTHLEIAQEAIRGILASFDIECPIATVEMRSKRSMEKYSFPGDPLIKVDGEIIPPGSGDILPHNELLRYKIARAAGLKTVLFVCMGNAIRSQMAEGIVNHRQKGRWAAFSAGVMPMAVPADVVRVMREIGIDISASRAKRLDVFGAVGFDKVILLCAEASSMCPELPEYEEKEYLYFRDPLASDMTVEGMCFSLRATFRGLRDEIIKKITGLFELSGERR